MKDYKQVTESVFRKSEERIKIAEKRRAVIRRTVYAVSGMCAAVIIGVGLWKNAAIKDAFRKDFHSSSIIEETSESISTTNTEHTTDFEQISVSNDRREVTTSVTSSVESQQSSIEAIITDTVIYEHTTLTVSNSENIRSSESTSAVVQTSTSFKTSGNTVTAVQTTYLQAVTSTKEIITPVEPDTETTNAGTEIMTLPLTEQPTITDTNCTVQEIVTVTGTNGLMGEDTAFFMLNGIGYTYSGIRIDNKYVGAFYCEIPFSYETAKTYKINGVSEEVALAVEFGDNGMCFIYTNSRYKPSDLSAMIKDLSLESYVHTGDAVCNQWGETTNYKNISTEELLKKMSEYTVTSKTNYPIRSDKDQLTIKAYHSAFKRYIEICVTSSGYVYISLSPYRRVFRIGSDNADRLIEYIVQGFNNS